MTLVPLRFFFPIVFVSATAAGMENPRAPAIPTVTPAAADQPAAMPESLAAMKLGVVVRRPTEPGPFVTTFDPLKAGPHRWADLITDAGARYVFLDTGIPDAAGVSKTFASRNLLLAVGVPESGRFPTSGAAVPAPWEDRLALDAGSPGSGVLIRRLCETVSRNGNLLLEITPDARGVLAPDVERGLTDLGEWMKLNGEALYHSRPFSPRASGDMVFTQRPDGVRYAIVLAKTEDEKMPVSVIIPAAVATGATSVVLLGCDDDMEVLRNPAGDLRVTIPEDVRQEYHYRRHGWTFKLCP